MNRKISPETARRLMISRQHLDGAERPSMLDVIRDIGCLQLDPISAVARSHLIVLFSRLGAYDEAELDRLLWDDRALFEYWAHEASIVLTEDYPVHHYRMRTYAESRTWSDQLHAWLDEIKPVYDRVMSRLHEEGPLLAREFTVGSRSGGVSTGWTSGRDVNKLLDFLWQTGQVMVAGRQGIQRRWDLAERCLPDWTPRTELDADAVTRVALERALKALGVARPIHITRHYTRRRYPHLNAVIEALTADGTIQPVTIDGWKGDDWFIHSDLLPELERIEAGDWQPRTTLLSPFDNLICDRQRTEDCFDFTFRIEIYVPAEKRQYGYYVLPILQGDRFIGRIDPRYDRKKHHLTVNAVYMEPDAPTDAATGQAVSQAIESLAGWLGAKTIDYGDIADGWRSHIG